MDSFRYFVPTDIHFGAGILGNFGEIAGKIGKKALVVTGRRSARASGALDRVLGFLDGAVVFDGVGENPTTDVCMAGGEVCRARGCDFVVGLGGGSAMDAAKGIAVMACNGGDCRDYLGVDRYAGGNLPVVAVPTTAGTGSEVTQYAVLVDVVEGSKRTLAGRGLFPVAAVVDPELTLSLPRDVTVYTGLDALSQGMEGVVSRRSTVLGDLLGLEVCRLVGRWLVRAADVPGDLEARSWLAYAAMLSGCVIAQSGTTLVHGMGYWFTLHYGTAHGLANALLLPAVFGYDAGFVPGKVGAIAAALGADGARAGSEPGVAVCEALYGLYGRLGLSAAGRDAGIGGERLDAFALEVAGDRSRFKNQVGAPGVGELAGFFRAAWSGRMD